MRDHHRHQLWIVVVAATIMLIGLGSTRLWDEDEAYFAGAAAEMHAQGDWVVPSFNGRLFAHKPPWMYWMMMIGFRLFGTTEFAARFFSAVFGVATCLLTYHLGRRLFGSRVGLWAGLIMASCVMFNVVSRAATPDSYLVFFSALSLYVFASTGAFQRPAAGSVASPPVDTTTKSFLPQRWRNFAAMYAVMGLAVLVKGPIGVLFPMAVIGMFLLATTPARAVAPGASSWRRVREACRPFGPVNFLGTVWRMRPLTAIAMVLLVAGPWYLAVGMRTEGAFLREFFGVHHFQRFTTSMESHRGPVYYYVVAVLVGMFPWSVFALPSLLLLVRHLRGRVERHAALVFVTCWAGVYLGLFTMAGTKLPNYVLPAYPALALIAAYFYQYWIDNPQGVHRYWHRIALGILAAVGIGGLVGLPAAALLQIEGRSLLDAAGLARDVQSDLVWLGLVGLPAFLGGIVAIVLAERGRIQNAVTALAATSIATMLVFWNYAAPRVDQYQTSEGIARTIQLHSANSRPRIAQFGYFRPSLVYYTRQRIARCTDSTDAARFLTAPGARFLITTGEGFEELRAVLPGGLEVLDRQPRFPETGDILLLATAGDFSEEPLALSPRNRARRR